MKKIPFILLIILISFNLRALMLNLKNVEISTFINTVSMATGKNFIVDPRVKGRVNIISNKEINDDQLYQIFLTVLKAYGFIVIEGEGVSRVVPKNLTKSESAYVSNNATDAIVTRIIQLKDVSVSQIAPIVRPLMSAYGLFSIYVPSNSVVVVDSGANVARLEGIINALDKPIDDDFEFIALKNSSASQIATIIKPLFVKKGGIAPNIAIDKHNNQLIVGGSKSKRLKIRLLIAELDKYKADSGTTAIVYLKYANAKDILPILQNISQYDTTQKTATKGKGAKIVKSNIQADESTNSIIVTGNNEIKQMIKDIIAKLDVRRAQVLIEVVIAEVNSNDAAELGIQWIAKGGAGIGLTNLNGALPSLLASDPDSLVGGLNFVAGNYNQKKQIGIGVLINALNSTGNTNILSTPSILTLDNHEAEIVVGKEVPFIVSSQNANNSNPFTQSVERKDVGIKLKVKPQINNGSSIKLDLEQEISNVLNSSNASDLITSKRTLKTSVMVEDGRMLVLGGLIDDTWGDSLAKVPLIGDIPFLGNLFTYKTKTKSKSNLMIFIRPTILKSQILSDDISMEKYNFIKAEQLLNSSDSSINNKNNFSTNHDKFDSNKKQNSNIINHPNSYNRPYNYQANEKFIINQPTIKKTNSNSNINKSKYKKVKNSPYYIYYNSEDE